MITILRIPGFLRLLLLAGFIQVVLADSTALPERNPVPVTQECASCDPPGQVDLKAPLEILAGARPAGLPGGPPVEVVRVLKDPWRLPVPSSHPDRLSFSGLSPPPVPSQTAFAF